MGEIQTLHVFQTILNFEPTFNNYKNFTKHLDFWFSFNEQELSGFYSSLNQLTLLPLTDPQPVRALIGDITTWPQKAFQFAIPTPKSTFFALLLPSEIPLNFPCNSHLINSNIIGLGRLREKRLNLRWINRTYTSKVIFCLLSFLNA